MATASGRATTSIKFAGEVKFAGKNADALAVGEPASTTIGCRTIIVTPLITTG
jgi:hypothetical protein